MKLKSFILFALFSFIPALRVHAESPYTVLPCSVEFPKSVKNIPQLCVYQGGERFPCEINSEGKSACFILPIDKACDVFYMLITEALSYEAEGNTVQYLKVITESPYKFYKMELVRAPKKKYIIPSTKKEDKDDEEKQKDKWIVSEVALPENGRIPDDAIIVLLNAEYVEKLQADNGFEFPKIIIKDDVLNIAGSEKALQDKAIELLLSSLDYNPLHVTSKTHTKKDQQNIIIAMAGV